VRSLAFLAAVFLFFRAAAVPEAVAEQQVLVLYAGSLGNLMEEDVGPAFARSTGYRYSGEAKGSVMSANLIKAKLRQPDVFISADPKVNDLLMGVDNGDLVRWYLTICGNAMVLGYNRQSHVAAELAKVRIGDFHLYEILQEKGIRLGRGDPELEPKGYRTIFLFELAEQYYRRPGLAANILEATDRSTLIFPEEQLVARLEAGQLDAGIFYRNEVVEHNLPCIEFPRALDLSDPDLNSDYCVATYRSSKGNTYSGSAIVYSVTILEKSSNRAAAIALVSYLLSDEGRSIMKRHGLRILEPTVSGKIDAVPRELCDQLSRWREE
jgi:molybdate/tungstate transport system substrate-binding protein